MKKFVGATVQDLITTGGNAKRESVIVSSFICCGSVSPVGRGHPPATAESAEHHPRRGARPGVRGPGRADAGRARGRPTAAVCRPLWGAPRRPGVRVRCARHGQDVRYAL